VKQILGGLGLITHGDERAWAVTSPDDRYRYLLGRMWDDYCDDAWNTYRALWVFGMLNPSKARHDVDDPTVRKCVGFARRGGAGGLVVVNLFAYSATDPRDLVRAWREGVDVRGPHNEAAIDWATSRPAFIGCNVAAWGRIPPRLRSPAKPALVQFLCSRPDCLGVNADGSPRHPLMLAYDTPIVPLAEARRAA
jgi:hypothetical protein